MLLNDGELDSAFADSLPTINIALINAIRISIALCTIYKINVVSTMENDLCCELLLMSSGFTSLSHRE